MTDYLFRPSGLQPGTTYRVDTGASNGTAAAITRVDPKTPIDGSKLKADAAGAVPEFVGTAATLYLRPLDYLGTPGTAVSSTGSAFPVATASTGVSQSDLTAAVAATLGGAPDWMNTLAEISTSINDDPAFAATVTAAIASAVAAERTTAATMTNKTIDTAGPNTLKVKGMTVDATGSNTGTWLFPSISGTINLVGNSNTQTITSKSLDTSNRIIDSSDSTKKVAFALSGITTGTTRTITVPNGDVTLTSAAATVAGLHGLKAVSLDPYTATGNGAITLGRIYFARVRVDDAATITGVIYHVALAASGATSGQNFVGLYDTSGNLLGVSADQTTNFGSTGERKAALTTPYAAAAGYYLIAILSNASTSGVGIARGNSNGSSPFAHNLNVTGVNSRFSSFTTGSQTSLPSTISTGSIDGVTSLPLLLGLY